MKKIIAVLALVLAPLSMANAAAPFAEVTAAKANDAVGAEFGLGTKLTAGNFALKPQIVAFVYDGDTPGYREYTQSNGSTVCKNTANGQYADKTDCVATKIAAAIKIELTYAVGTWGEFGVGARMEKKAVPYLTISKTISPMMSLKFNGGKDYVGIGLAFGR